MEETAVHLIPIIAALLEQVMAAVVVPSATVLQLMEEMVGTITTN
jgi:predicted Zn-dependent protease